MHLMQGAPCSGIEGPRTCSSAASNRCAHWAVRCLRWGSQSRPRNFSSGSGTADRGRRLRGRPTWGSALQPWDLIPDRRWSTLSRLSFRRFWVRKPVVGTDGPHQAGGSTIRPTRLRTTRPSQL